jgi:hypothetical protein
MSIFETDDEEKKRLLRDIRDRVSEQASMAEWDARQERAAREDARYDAERRHRELLEAADDERQRPHREAIARRALVTLLESRGAASPFVEERYKRDHKGYSVEETAWQNFADELVKFERFSEMMTRDEERGVPPAHTARWLSESVRRIEAIAASELRHDDLAPLAIGAVRAHYSHVVSRASDLVEQDDARLAAEARIREEEAALEQKKRTEKAAAIAKAFRVVAWSGGIAVLSFVSCTGVVVNGGSETLSTFFLRTLGVSLVIGIAGLARALWIEMSR